MTHLKLSYMAPLKLSYPGLLKLSYVASLMLSYKAPLELSYVAHLTLSYKALLKLSYEAPLMLSYKALLELSYMALQYPSSLAPDLSYVALLSSFPWESARGFNADLWGIGTDRVDSQASRFLYK